MSNATETTIGLYCFDFMLTFDQQVCFFRSRKLSLATVLFAMMNVSGSLALLISPMAGMTNTCEVCITLAHCITETRFEHDDTLHLLPEVSVIHILEVFVLNDNYIP